MRIRLIIIFGLLLFFSVGLMAQGVSRSTGIGMQLGFWNITDHSTQLSISGVDETPNVHVGGIGVWFSFFSRAYHNWYLDFKVGLFGSVHAENIDVMEEEEMELDATVIVPVLLGLRYDLLSTKMPSAIQPFLSFGGGRYWAANVIQDDAGETVKSDVLHGLYFGGGTNIVIASWLAINFDLRYHFVDYKIEKGISGLEFNTGINFMWGRRRELFKIKDIKLVVSDIYPAYYQFYNMYPIALVSIKNVAGYPIEVNVKSYIEHYSERPQHTGFVDIPEGKTKDIQITAIFGPRLMGVTRNKPAVLDIEVEVRAGRTEKRTVSAQIMVHNRNAWNGDVDKLGCFITPDNEEILQLSRNLAGKIAEDAPAQIQNFIKARKIFDELQNMGIHYHRDPNIPYYRDDRVQFATETLHIKSGDCDDLVVLFASLLESLGINTAFVEVRDPGKEIAHLYLIFDTGLEPDVGYLISENEKRYIVRDKLEDRRTIWIPVETTLVDMGFEEAWKAGALAYLQEVNLRNGLYEGWIKIFDIE